MFYVEFDINLTIHLNKLIHDFIDSPSTSDPYSLDWK